jgi:heparanase
MEVLRTTVLKSAMLAVGVIGLLPKPVLGQMPVQPGLMPKMGQVDPRFASYNIEAVEVTGGRFWRPFKDETAPNGSAIYSGHSGSQPTVAREDPYEYRPPINLDNSKLRKLAMALEPSYLRVSGTWMNSTFFQNDDATIVASPPKGYKGVLTRAEWKGVVDFSRAVGGELVTSVAISDGTRDESGVCLIKQRLSSITPRASAAIFPRSNL